jgi:hypothetical protein
MLRCLLLILFALSSLALSAQADYRGALGLRAGPGFGLSGKYFLNQDIALEGHFRSRRMGYELTALAMQHRDLGWQRNFNWYYGGGLHTGFSEYRELETGRERTRTTLGLDGVLGLEYTFIALPVNLALDWKPEVNVTGATGVCLTCAGLSLRYAFR